MSTHECRYCEKSFNRDESKRNWRHIKFCSDKCRKAYAAQKKREIYKPRLIEDKACLFCKKTYTPSPTQGAKQKYCSRKCYLSQKKYERAKDWKCNKTILTCPYCDADFTPHKYSPNVQVYCSIRCQVNSSNKRHNKKWKRPGAALYEFNKIKPLILDRDERCVVCESTDRLHVHHWDNSGRSETCNNTLDNLATLCSQCHSDIHKVTLAKVDGEWCLDGSIFEKLGLAGSVQIMAARN